MLRGKMEPEAECRCGGERWNRRPNVVAAEKDGTGERKSLRRRKMEPESECRCGGAGCHSGGFLLRIMPPSWQPVPACVRHGHSAGGPFFRAAAMVLQAEPFFFATTTIVLQAEPFFFAATTIVLQAEPIFFAATTIVLHRFQSLALKSRIDARKIV